MKSGSLHKNDRPAQLPFPEYFGRSTVPEPHPVFRDHRPLRSINARGIPVSTGTPRRRKSGLSRQEAKKEGGKKRNRTSAVNFKRTGIRIDTFFGIALTFLMTRAKKRAVMPRGRFNFNRRQMTALNIPRPASPREAFIPGHPIMRTRKTGDSFSFALLHRPDRKYRRYEPSP